MVSKYLGGSMFFFYLGWWFQKYVFGVDCRAGSFWGEDGTYFLRA